MHHLKVVANAGLSHCYLGTTTKRKSIPSTESIDEDNPEIGKVNALIKEAKKIEELGEFELVGKITQEIKLSDDGNMQAP